MFNNAAIPRHYAGAECQQHLGLKANHERRYSDPRWPERPYTQRYFLNADGTPRTVCTVPDHKFTWTDD